jgi:glycosyltransferase involved in cell wall biosynthesis
MDVIIQDPGRPRWDQLELPRRLALLQSEVFYSPTLWVPLLGDFLAVMTIHDLIPRTHPHLATPIAKQFYAEWLEPCLRRAAHVVTVSGAAAKQIMDSLGTPEDQVSIVRQTIAPAYRLRPTTEVRRALARLRIPLPYVLFVGCADERKGFDIALEAVAEARLSERSLNLVVVGAQGAAKEWAHGRVQRVSAETWTRFLGYVPDEALACLYAGAEALLFPSRAEGFGRPVTEALACGTTVIVSASTPCVQGEAAPRNALLVEPSDAGRFAEALRSILRDGGHNRQDRACGLDFAKGFTPRQMIDDLVKAVERALARRDRCGLESTQEA